GRTAGSPLRNASVGISSLDQFEEPLEFQVPSFQGSNLADHSDRVRHALERLHAQHHFDLVEFPARNGVALRSLQAKRTGLTFADVDLVVRLGMCGPQLREREQRWPGGPDDLEADFAEGYTVEHADVQVIAPRAMAKAALELGWSVRDDALVEP